MKSIVSSQLTGKWYLIAQSQNDKMMSFLEVFIYLSISCDKLLDLLFVGIKVDGSKLLRKLSLKIEFRNDDVFIIVKNAFFRKKLKVLTFDEKNELMIIADNKMKYLSMYSRKPNVKHELLESSLSEINVGNVNLYSNNIL